MHVLNLVQIQHPGLVRMLFLLPAVLG